MPIDLHPPQLPGPAGFFIRAFANIVLVVAGLAAFGCTAHQKPSSVETALANAAKDIVIPIEADSMTNPLTANPQMLARGSELYQQNCAVCHGADGHGQTVLGQGMYPPAMDLTSPHVQHWSDPQMFWIIQNGVRLTGMASWKSSISTDDTWKLVVFVRALPEQNESAPSPAPKNPAKTPEQLIAYGRTLYRQEGCFTCHRLDGEGSKVGPDLDVEGTRGRNTAWLVGHFKAPAMYVPGSIMPAFKNLTDEQLSALAAFLETQKGSRK